MGGTVTVLDVTAAGDESDAVAEEDEEENDDEFMDDEDLARAPPSLAALGKLDLGFNGASEAPQAEYVEKTVHAPKEETPEVDQIAHVPQVEYAEKIVEVPQAMTTETYKIAEAAIPEVGKITGAAGRVC